VSLKKLCEMVLAGRGGVKIDNEEGLVWDEASAAALVLPSLDGAVAACPLDDEAPAVGVSEVVRVVEMC
jgi:hypothetical protein